MDNIMAHDFKEVMTERSLGDSVWWCWKCGTLKLVVDDEETYFVTGEEPDLLRGITEEPECLWALKEPECT